MKISWLLLVSLFCRSSQDDGVFHCEAQNVTVTDSGQTILFTWDDEPSCSAKLDQDVLTYEVLVLIVDTPVHHEEIEVTPDHIGSTHSWNWTSLALECKSHSVKLRSRYKNHTSKWKQIHASAGKIPRRKTGVFPIDNVFRVGSRATFCCVLPEGGVFKEMYLRRYSSATTTTRINNQIYALTVDPNQASKSSCTDVICEINSTIIISSTSGTCAYFGYPPDDKDLQCETQDLKSVKCHWTVGRHTSNLKRLETNYQLLGGSCGARICSQKAEVDVGERKWTVTAQNKLGKLELSDTADLTKRVHMLPPNGVKASTLNARNISLEWEWTVPQYYNLNITCQVNLSHGNTTSEIFGVGLNFSVLNDLIPNWKYNVAVRCGTAQHFWKWSDWSTSYYFHTKGDIPDALDVWMQKKGNQSIIIWKMPLANQSHGDIIDYEVTWAKTTERGRPNRTKVAHTNTSLALSLEATEEYIVTVTARNINGSSPPSTITRRNPGSATVNPSQIIGTNGGFNLSWSPSPAASCGYTVDWCPTKRECIVEWLKVAPNETNASIFSENFKDGQRYSLSVHACTQGAPVLLERKEGYVSEKKIPDGLFKSLNGKPQHSGFVVSWDPVLLEEQTAFIQGYVLYWSDSDRTAVCCSTDDPGATSLTARDLKISSYSFTLKAKTAVGECGDTSFTTTFNPLDDNHVMETVIISLVTVFGLLSLVIILCYRHWTCIKLKVCPPIPKPVLSLPGKRICRPLFVEPSSEADIIDVAELCCTEGTPINDYISQENMPFGYTQTPKGYSNQPLKRNTPPPFTLPTKATPPQSGFPSSPFRSVYPNPSYSLIMQLRNQKIHPGPGLQEGKSVERSSDGYQPHDHGETFTINQTEEDLTRLMSCVSAYITLPKSPPE